MQYFFIFLMAVSWDPNQANEDKSQQLRGEKHKEMTNKLPLLRKCGHFPAPKRDISLVFLYRYSGHLSTSSKILTHIT